MVGFRVMVGERYKLGEGFKVGEEFKLGVVYSSGTVLGVSVKSPKTGVGLKSPAVAGRVFFQSCQTAAAARPRQIRMATPVKGTQRMPGLVALAGLKGLPGWLGSI